MKISWKNIENWRSWKTRFFWGGHFEFFESAILNFFLLHFSEKRSPFIWGIIFFCTMDGFSRILEKKLSKLLCTRLYLFDSDIFFFAILTRVNLWGTIKTTNKLELWNTLSYSGQPYFFETGSQAFRNNYKILSLFVLIFTQPMLQRQPHYMELRSLILKPYLFGRPNPISAIISWIIS